MDANIDLLSTDKQALAIIPTVTTSCFTSYYNLRRKLDDANMVALFSSIVSKSSSKFELELSDDDYTNRHNLWNSGTQYVVRRVLTGTLDTSIT